MEMQTLNYFSLRYGLFLFDFVLNHPRVMKHSYFHSVLFFISSLFALVGYVQEMASPEQKSTCIFRYLKFSLSLTLLKLSIILEA